MKPLRSRLPGVLAIAFGIVAISPIARATAEPGDDWIAFSLASYHQQRGKFNERNTGAGMEFSLLDSRVKLIGGHYVNSLWNEPNSRGETNYAGLGLMPIRIGNFHLGLNAGVASGYSKEPYWKSGAIPSGSWEGKTFGFNAFFIPPIGDLHGVLGLQFKARIDWSNPTYP